MKKIAFLIVALVFTIVSCENEHLPVPKADTTESTEGGGDDAEDPIIED
ncbi:MAG: hypothetical protein MI921_13000 [Cytophagales bacterium]|nr:hypothetical protein [Cytophagales bacterium]